MQGYKNRARGQHQYPIAASAPHVYETPRVTVETCGNQGNDHSDGDGNRKPDQYKADILAPAFEIELFFSAPTTIRAVKASSTQTASTTAVTELYETNTSGRKLKTLRRECRRSNSYPNILRRKRILPQWAKAVLRNAERLLYLHWRSSRSEHDSRLYR